MDLQLYAVHLMFYGPATHCPFLLILLLDVSLYQKCTVFFEYRIIYLCH